MKIPNKAYLDFTPEEKSRIPIKALGWKHEGKYGPLWVIFESLEWDDFWQKDVEATRNYKDSEDSVNIDDTPYAEWYSFKKAEKIAYRMSVPLNCY